MAEQPWLNEPDKLDFEAHGLQCRMRRNHFDAWCGYVKVPPSHPWHGKGYEDVVEVLPHVLQQEVDPNRLPVIALAFGSPGSDPEAGRLEIQIALNAHGGITFAGPHWEDKSGWWFGFDCSHCDDLAPGMMKHRLSRGVYRDVDYVRAECESLAEQLAAYSQEPTRDE